MTTLSVDSKRTARNKVFGQLLRERRSAAGQTQETLAFAAGLERTTVSIIERGHRSISLQTLYQLSCALTRQPQSLFALGKADYGRRMVRFLAKTTSLLWQQDTAHFQC
jgi:transcriptional regulator with XRE-family HTH domain